MISRNLRLGGPLAVLPVALLFAACQQDRGISAPDAEPGSVARPARASLDRRTADSRKARIENLEYELFIDIHASDAEFLGEATIRFDLDAASDLTVDFGGGAIDELRVNGEPVAADYNGFFITLPGAKLTAGRNAIDVAFRHGYDEDGTGLHRFVDPEDGLTYLYTYLWPYYANRLFPAFDQPNLKATLSLTVLAPESWTVVSTGAGSSEPAEEGARVWHFATTPKMSTYVFSLHAGPYRIWEAAYGDLPLKLMARHSLADYVAVDEWFDVTKRGLEHYGRYFDIPYPFTKYDQLVVPDFNIGAMENIGAVTFSEDYVQRRQSDRTERESRASIILHEMAHMWFGNLVTHDWWNGMWLNESFATQMAAIAETEVTEFEDTWHGFFTLGKQRAYLRDSRVTTHPIEMPVRATDEFFTVFDAITYQKGASVLKQLEHLVGGESYRQGVAAYLKEHAYGTTRLEDFIGHQARSAGMDLEGWSDQWLHRAGFNTLAAETRCDGDELRSIVVAQSAPADHPHLRRHRISVALYNLDEGGVLAAGDVLPLEIHGERTEVEVSGEPPCPALVNPNHDDWAYARIALDDATVAVLDDELGNVPDALGRSIFLAALFDRAMAGDLTLADYVERALRLAENEQNIRVVQQISGSIIDAVDMMRRLRPETDGALARLVPAIEATSLRRAELAEAQDLKRLWLKTFLGVASSETGLERVRALLDGRAEIAGVDVSADIRWELVEILSRHGVSDIEALLEMEKTRDPSDSGAKSLLTARASMPDAAQKAQWIDELGNPETLTGLARQRAVLAGLFPANQTDLQLALLERVLGSLPELAGNADPYFISSYVTELLRPMCRDESSAMMQAAIDDYATRLDTTTLMFLREAHQADRECLWLRGRQ